MYVGSVAGVIVGAVLAWVSIYGVVTSQTSGPDQSPVNANQAVIEYGTNG